VTLGKKRKRKYKNMNKFWMEKMREKIKEEKVTLTFPQKS
jgi:hypothetical protein